MNTCNSCQSQLDPKGRGTTGYCRQCYFNKFSRSNARRRWEERPWFTGRDSTVRRLSAVEAAWVGAMLEGEGNFNVCEVRSPTARTGLHKKFAVRSSSTEIETIATVLRLVGDGGVSTYQSPLPKHKRAWNWEMQNRLGIIDLIPQIIPYLTSKREIAEAMYAELIERMSRYERSEKALV